MTIKNKNRHIYELKSKIKGYIYRNPFMLKNFLNLKEVFIRRSGFQEPENTLFKKVFIETISYCNNDCAFCPASTKVGAKMPGSFMREDLYIKILNELADIHFTGSVAFHCNNEPLLDRRLILWIKIARSLLKTNFFYLYTNGIFIDIKLANQLLEAGLNRIIINNYNDKHELIPSIRSLIDNSSFVQGEIIVNYRVKTDYLENRAGENPNIRSFLKEPLKNICVRPLTEIVVGYDGTVPLCCADGLWKVTMGNAGQTSLKDIWFSDFFKRIRRSLATGNRNCAEICRVCDALNFSAPRGIRD
ncbi:MAG: radical SAM/SPASM domain-containing protein [Candidatus Omnitrophota bacterium]